MSMQSAGNQNSFQKNLALLGACCLFLSAVEYLIPKPLPFMRIGLANLPLMLALDIFPLPAFLVLVCIKIFGQALITGTLFSYVFLFSVGGTLFSALLMYALRRIFKQRITFIGIGTAGAMVSNAAQLALAYVFIFKENVRYIAPPFLAAGLVTGVVLGIVCETFIKRSYWYWLQKTDCKEGLGTRDLGQGLLFERNVLLQQAKIINNANKSQIPIIQSMESEPQSPAPSPQSQTKTLFLIGLLVMPIIVFNPSTELRVLIFLLLWLLVFIFRKKTNPLITIFIIVFIVAFNLIVPYGRVLFSFGSFKITGGALQAGIHRAVTLQALVMLSKLTVRDDLKLPGAFGGLLAESLRIFSAMMNRKTRFTRKNLIKEIDRMLLELGGS